MAQHRAARPAELRGHVVLVNFWTWTCVSWLRQEPYVRAWARKWTIEAENVLPVDEDGTGVLVDGRM